MGIDELLKEKRQDILRVAERHGAYNVRVFGSVARGEANPDSDIDFLVEAGPVTSSWFPAGSSLTWKTCWGGRWMWSLREPCTGTSETVFYRKLCR